MSEPMPYQMALTCGDLAGVSVPAPTAVDVTPGDKGPVEALAASGIKTADMRSKVCFVAGAAPIPALLSSYAAACGFAGRVLDVHVAGKQVPAVGLHAMAAAVADAGRPTDRVAVVQIGGVRRDDVLWINPADVNPDGAIDAALVSQVRWARRLRLVVPDSPTAALVLFMVASGLRARGGRDRFPLLCDGTEAVDVPDDDTEAGVDLDGFRQAGNRARRDNRPYDVAVVPAEAVDARRARLIEAAKRPAAEVLALAGSEEHNGLWNCPRPWAHTHGDATPSAKVFDDKFRCHRCDSEALDMVRLVAAMINGTPDEAADLLLGPDDVWASLKAANVAERAARSAA